LSLVGMAGVLAGGAVLVVARPKQKASVCLDKRPTAAIR
jgi:hypothetical protein